MRDAHPARRHAPPPALIIAAAIVFVLVCEPEFEFEFVFGARVRRAGLGSREQAGTWVTFWTEHMGDTFFPTERSSVRGALGRLASDECNCGPGEGHSGTERSARRIGGDVSR